MTFAIAFVSQTLVLTALLAFPYLLGHGQGDILSAMGPLAVILLWSLLAAGEKLVQPEAPRTEHREDTRWRRASLLLLWLLLPLSAFDARFSPSGLGVGVTLMLAGGGLRLWSLHALGPLFTWTTGVTGGHQVIRHGPYRFFKHPNYIGNALFASGIVVATASLVGALIWLLFLGCVVQTARHEARYLRQHLPGYP